MVRNAGGIKNFWTPHGCLQIYIGLNDDSIKKEIKKKSKFQNKELKKLYNQLYQEQLDHQIPWNAIVGRDEDFKQRIKEKYDSLQLARKPISSSCKQDCIETKIFGSDVKIFYEPHLKGIKIEGVESKDPNGIFIGVVPIIRLQLNDYDVNDPNLLSSRKKTVGANKWGLNMFIGVETRVELTRTETVLIGFFLWSAYQYIYSR